MNHRELGETYLTLLEAVKHTGLSEEGAVLHSEEIWMYCPRVPMKEQLIKDTEADVVSNWIGMGEVSGETEEIELQHLNPLSISPTSEEDPSCEPVQPTLYVTRAGLEQYLDKNSSSDSPIR